MWPEKGRTGSSTEAAKNMRVLAIYPGMDKRFDANAYALIQLRRMGIELAVVTSRHSALKTRQLSPEYEDMERVSIHRMYRDFSEQTAWPVKKYDLVRELATRFKPDLIFCSQQLNVPLAKRLKAEFGLPIVLLLEFAWDPMLLLGGRRHYLGLKPLAPLIAKHYWRSLCVSSDAIITCNPADRHHLDRLAVWGTPVHYVGWCNEKPEGVGRWAESKKRGRGIYAGSLQKRSFKNSEELIRIVPEVLRNTPTEEFVVIGNGSLAQEIRELEDQWKGRLKYIDELSRREVWELVAGSFYAYTPVRFGGWGFIGDTWSARTPLVVTHNGYEFTDGKDAIISSPEGIGQAITELYRNDRLYGALQEGGESRYVHSHTAERAARDISRVFRDCLATH